LELQTFGIAWGIKKCLKLQMPKMPKIEKKTEGGGHKEMP